jgi:hypothetical protein
MGRAAAKARARYEASERALLAALSPAATFSSSSMPSVYVLPADGSNMAGPVGLSTPGSGMRAGAGAGSATPGSPSAGSSRPLDTNVMLQLLFQYYCRFGRTSGMTDDEDTLDSFNFAKFTRECPGLLDKTLNPTEVDLVFVKVRTKGARRLTYSQWLDALSAMATVKYEQVDDPAASFSLFLTTHVFTNPAAIGISQAVRSGLISIESTGTGSGAGASPRPRSRASSRSGSVDAGARAGSVAGSAAGAGPAAGRFSSAAASVGMSPTAVRGHRLAPEVGEGPAPSLQAAPSPRNVAATPGSGSGAGATPSAAALNLPPELQAIPGIVEAVLAAAEALNKARGGGPGSPGGAGEAPPSSARSVGDAGSVRSERSSIGPAGASLVTGGFPAPPADVFELISRKALEIQLQTAAASGSSGAPSTPAHADVFLPSSSPAQNLNVSPRRSNSPRPWSPMLLQRGNSGADALGIARDSYPSVRAVASLGASLETLGEEARERKRGKRRGRSGASLSRCPSRATGFQRAPATDCPFPRSHLSPLLPSSPLLSFPFPLRRPPWRLPAQPAVAGGKPGPLHARVAGLQARHCGGVQQARLGL